MRTILPSPPSRTAHRKTPPRPTSPSYDRRNPPHLAVDRSPSSNGKTREKKKVNADERAIVQAANPYPDWSRASRARSGVTLTLTMQGTPWGRLDENETRRTGPGRTRGWLSEPARPHIFCFLSQLLSPRGAGPRAPGAGQPVTRDSGTGRQHGHAPPMNVSGGSRAGAEAVSSGSPECPGGTGRGGVARERSARRHLNEAMQHRRAALHLQPGYARTSPPHLLPQQRGSVGPGGSCELATPR